MLLPVLVWVHSQCFAASFDCRKASHRVERAICGDSILSGLDSRLSQEWKAASKAFPASSDAAYLKGRQKAWVDDSRRRELPLEELRRRWTLRLEELSFKRGLRDLRTIPDTLEARTGVRLESRGTCLESSFDSEEGVAQREAADVLELRRGDPPGLLHFEYAKCIDQHECRGCDVSGLAREVGSTPGRRRFRWKMEVEEDTSAGIISFWRDSIEVVVERYPRSLCGDGAGFDRASTFRRSGLWLLPER
ncbi:MAG: hypothetical protein H6686_12290 [Fibrobacteria bacterium]|nr:hypothetical protein [Fibrobacteria bacterium]